MNSTEYILALIAAFLIGGIAGALVGHKYAGKEYKASLERAHDERDALRQERNELANKKTELVEKMAEHVDASLASLKDEAPNETRDYTELSAKYRPSVTAPEKKKPVNEDTPRLPFRISEEAANEAEDTIIIRFYTRDRVLLDDRGSPIDNPEEVIGEILAKTLHTERDEVVYVQNDKRGVVYEIFIEKGLSYKHDVLGFDEDDDNE